jgi:hypothetical protein
MRDPGARRRRGRIWRASALALALACGLAGPVAAQDAPDDAEMRAVFERILADPGNPELNFRYAELAIRRGELRKALGAYERILARDPQNREAQAALRRVQRQLEPAITRFSVLAGAQYESNARRENFQNSRTHDGSFFARGEVFDERTIGTWRWRSTGEVYANYHLRFHDIDYGVVQARTGPVLDLFPNVRFHPFVGGGYAWLARRTFYGEATAGAVFEFDVFAPVRDVLVRWGYDWVGRSVSTRDATFVEIMPRLQFPNLGKEGAIGIASPFWRYNGVFGSGAPGFDPRNDLFPQRSHQIGGRFDYFFPVLQWLTLNVNFTYEYRHFFERVTDESKNRRDHTFIPGVQAIVPGLAGNRADLVFHYAYEHRTTNDGPQRYENHIAGVRVLWRF